MNADRKPTSTLKAPAPSSSASTSVQENVDGIPLDAIAQRAYEIFVASGSQNGRDVEHWLEAERQLRKDPKYR